MLPLEKRLFIWPLLTSIVSLQVVSDAAGEGVAITGNQTFNNWNWPNAMIFAATVITTIGKYSGTLRMMPSSTEPYRNIVLVKVKSGRSQPGLLTLVLGGFVSPWELAMSGRLCAVS